MEAVLSVLKIPASLPHPLLKHYVILLLLAGKGLKSFMWACESLSKIVNSDTGQ